MYYGAYGPFLAVNVQVPERVLALESPLYYNYNFHFITFALIVTLFYLSIEAVVFSQIFFVPSPLHTFSPLYHIFRTFHHYFFDEQDL